MLQKIWKIVIFHLSLYNKTWDSPTLINLTNLTRGVRYCEVPNPFLVSGSGAEKAPIMNYCSFGRCVFLFFNMLSPGGGDGAGGKRLPAEYPPPKPGNGRIPAQKRPARGCQRKWTILREYQLFFRIFASIGK